MLQEFIQIVLAMESMVVGFTELTKQYIADSKYYPLIAIFWGLIFGMGYIVAEHLPTTYGEWIIAVFASLFLGLGATGLYKAGSTIAKKIGQG